MFMDSNSNEFNLYQDIQKRTGGEIYLGVVGPVRTGKSTFIKRFLELMVLLYMEEYYAKEIAKDEMHQSDGGKTITTTEPKFIPKEAATLTVADGIEMKVRLIDCVGYMVPGAGGHMEDDVERMVKTPWFDYEVPFTKAAEIGTRKVISDHSTIGIVVTTDGSFGELPRENFVEAEENTISELKTIGKPFVIVLNTQKPFSDEAQKLKKMIGDKYKASCVAVNCEQLKKEDIIHILEEALYEFPISCIEFYMPKWVEMMMPSHPMQKELIDQMKSNMGNIQRVRDITYDALNINSKYVKKSKLDKVDLSKGSIKYHLEVDDIYYYEMISELVGEEIKSEYQMLELLKLLADKKREYDKVDSAIQSVRNSGYGVVMPQRDEITLDVPEVIKHGNKYGVKIKAESPSIHMIRANIQTEIAPIVGTREQAEDLIHYIEQEQSGTEGMWETNIFGKTVEQLVNDGISSKIGLLNEESQVKLQDTMQKIVNDSNGGMICIII